MPRRPAAVSIEENFYAESLARASALGMNWSAYVNALIRQDMLQHGPLVINESGRTGDNHFGSAREGAGSGEATKGTKPKAKSQQNKKP